MQTEEINKYKQEFYAKNYDRLHIALKAGEKKKIEDIAKEKGKSLNDFVIGAIYKEAGLPRPENKPRGRKKKTEEPDTEE